MTRPSPFSTLTPRAVTLSVQNLEVMTQWYNEKLDFQIVKEKDYPAFGTSLVFLALNHYQVELIKDAQSVAGHEKPKPPAHTRFQGITQFSFTTDDLKGLKAALRDRGVPITWAFQNEELGLSFIFITDPEGNLIQFIQPF